MHLEALQVLAAVAELRSFTKAAARLSLDKSHVSRVVRRLEQAVGAELLLRTTRSVKPSAEGEALLRRVAPALAELDAALSTAADRPKVPSGVVGITTTNDLGQAYLAPLLSGFRARFPAVQLQVLLTSELVELSAGVDLAVRVGKPGSQALVARKLADLSAGFFASPAYLERNGVPERLEQLARHEGLWPAASKGRRAFASSSGLRPAVQCADFALLAEVARAGGGIALLPTFLAARHVAHGALVRVLPGFSLGGAPLYLVSRPVRSLPPRVAALRSYLLGATFP